VKRMGPKTGPWGTPQDEVNMKEEEEEEEEPEVAEKDMLER